MRSKILILLSLFSAGLIQWSCDRSRNDKGYEYFPDMAHSLAYETYSPNPNFKDKKTMQLPVDGAIPREMIPYQYPAGDSGKMLAGAALKNPLEPTAANIQTGKEKFRLFCQNCHGEQGKGDGYLFKSGRFPVQPKSLVSDKMMNAPPGDIFHVITRGTGVMGAHGAMIKPDDRWRIVLYVQHEIQHKQ
jgi:mono/diheme cytochrome c family protein